MPAYECPRVAVAVDDGGTFTAARAEQMVKVQVDQETLVTKRYSIACVVRPLYSTRI